MWLLLVYEAEAKKAGICHVELSLYTDWCIKDRCINNQHSIY